MRAVVGESERPTLMVLRLDTHEAALINMHWHVCWEVRGQEGAVCVWERRLVSSLHDPPKLSF